MLGRIRIMHATRNCDRESIVGCVEQDKIAAVASLLVKPFVLPWPVAW
jgi:hypothetical protein